MSRGGSGFGQGTVRRPSQQGLILGTLQACVRRALAARWAGLPGEQRSLVALGVWMFSGVSLWDVVQTWAGIRPRNCRAHGCRSASRRGSWTGRSEFSGG